MKSVSLNAHPRTLARRAGSKKLRHSGRVPAVIYGLKNEPKKLEVNEKEFESLIHHSVSENVLVDLSVSGETTGKHLALVHDIQHHALSGKILHVDFHEVSADAKVTVSVPVETTGEAAGVKSGGGVLEHVLFKVKLRALPKDLPEVLALDVTNLQIGQAIHIGDIQPPEGVEVLGLKKIVVVAVAAPLTEAAEVAAGETGTAEVEMIKEKKEDGVDAAKGGAKAGAKAGDKAADKGGEKKAEKKK